MRVLRARHLGMCFGVRDAIALAVRESASRPLTVLGELVHNETVLDDLRARGIRFCGDVDEVETPCVMITAHGASERRLATARDRGLDVLDATCFLVRTAHGAVMTMARDGPPSGHRRPAGPRGGARADRGPRGVRRGAGRRGRAPPDAATPGSASSPRRRSPSRGSSAWRRSSGSGFPTPRCEWPTRSVRRPSGARTRPWSWRALRRRHRHRRRPQQQHPRTGWTPAAFTARASSTCRPRRTCAPSGSRAPAWSASRRAPPRRTGSSTMSRRGCGRSPVAGWRRRPVCG